MVSIVPQIMDRYCPQICTRWEYNILSLSYGSIFMRDEIVEYDQNTTEPWSKINVFFPQASYRWHIEESVNIVYLALCDIGGVMGIYIGLSMISLAQMFAYG